MEDAFVQRRLRLGCGPCGRASPPGGLRNSRGMEDAPFVQRRLRLGCGRPSLRRLVNQMACVLGMCIGRDKTLCTLFKRPREHWDRGRGYVSSSMAVMEAIDRKRHREEAAHADDTERFGQLDALYDAMDAASKAKLNSDVEYLAGRSATSGNPYSPEQIRFLRYRMIYLMFQDAFPSRPLETAAIYLVEDVRTLEYNHPRLFKSFHRDPTRGYGNATGFQQASRRLVCESWVRSNDKDMVSSTSQMMFLGGHPTAGMHRPDDVPCLTRQLDMVHNG